MIYDIGNFPEMYIYIYFFWHYLLVIISPSGPFLHQQSFVIPDCYWALGPELLLVVFSDLNFKPEGSESMKNKDKTS